MSTDATLQQAGHVLTLIAQKGVTKDQLTSTVSDGTLPDFLEAVAMGTVPSRQDLRSLLGLKPLVFKIVVDYSMTLEEMIVVGRYDQKSDIIMSDEFSLLGKGTVEVVVELVHFNHRISSDTVEKELNKRGLRPATIEELLAFGVTFPEIQQKLSIVALGSCAKLVGGRAVACLGGRDSRRDLGLYWWDGIWGASFHFLAVRK